MTADTTTVAPPATASGPLETALWAAYARVYDNLLHLTGYRRLLDAVADVAAVDTGHHVVEVGCGTGNVLQRLARHRPATLLGIDGSGPMLTRARRKLRRGPVPTQLRQDDVVAGLAALPAGSVDRLVAVNVLYALHDRDAFWREARRVLRPTGSVVVSHTDRPGSWPLITEHVHAVGPRALAHVGLVVVALVDALIDTAARTGTWEFCDYPTLSEEAGRHGFAAEYRGRCYGGDVEGVNFLACYRPR